MISRLLGRILCRYGMHRAETIDGRARLTPDGYERCARCGWVGWPTW